MRRARAKPGELLTDKNLNGSSCSFRSTLLIRPIGQSRLLTMLPFVSCQFHVGEAVQYLFVEEEGVVHVDRR